MFTSKRTIIFIITTIFAWPPRYLAKPPDDSSSYYYDLCTPFQCGGINFTFPFSNSTMFGTGPRDCGLPRFEISCNAASSTPSIDLSGRLYRVKKLFPDPNVRVITLVDTELVKDLSLGSCESLDQIPNLTTIGISNPIVNLSLPLWNLNYFTFSFFLCPQGLTTSLSPEFLDAAVTNQSCSDGHDELYLFTNSAALNRPGLQTTGVETPEGCRRVEVPISDAISSAQWNHLNKSERWDLLLQVLGDGFPLTWSEISSCNRCQKTSGGRCGYDSGSLQAVCFLKDGNRQNKSSNRGIVIGIASGCSSVVLFVALALLWLLYWKRIRRLPSSKSRDGPTKENIDAASFIRTYQSTVIRSYSYKEIKKMTDSFKEKLGEGGYGSVYKGKLSDGRLVAVKRLDKSPNHETQDFVNEVSTIGRIHHFHIIHLLGFCLEGSNQALVYEFMPNGSLGDVLNKEGTNLFSSLGIEKLLEISIGIAQGIQYLHIGCESRILHLDIKPQNILLDQNLNPKVSDFGLAKMYPRNKSAVTVTGTRGTIGYIAPEIFMRNLGNPSDRSDVYSFGMLLLDMVGERERNRGGDDEWKESKSSEQYFPGWVYDKLINGGGGITSTDQEVVEEEVLALRKMVMMGLWCIQMNPRDRPSMTKVVEMLSGGVEAIEMPPKPFFFSPPRVQMETQNLTSTELDSTGSLPLRLDSGEYYEN